VTSGPLPYHAVVPFDIEWVVLTMGDRAEAMHAAVRSLLTDDRVGVVVVSNGAGDLVIPDDPRVRVVVSSENLGVPGGRHAGLAECTAPIVGFLDDDAVAAPIASARILEEFAGSPDLGAVSLRLVDEEGSSARRHVPRPRGTSPEHSGDVALFLGGASAIRRDAYEQVGGYFCDLFYGHEEVELSWRLVDAGWQIRYLADVTVCHPRTEIGRHEHGWRLTGRNRVWIARRTLAWPVAMVHVMVWLVLGVVRAPDTACRRSYVRGWWEGWRTNWDDGSLRRPITWRGVWRLTRLGRPPVI
jgi:GT2 family glycosyltransferase